jgi:hypothetical protein
VGEAMVRKFIICQMAFVLSLSFLSAQASQPEGIRILEKSHFVLEMDQKKVNHILDIQGMESLELTPVPEDSPGVSRGDSEQGWPADRTLKIERASDGNQILSNWYQQKKTGKPATKNLTLLLMDSQEKTVLKIELVNAIPISLVKSEAKTKLGKASEVLQIKYEKLSIKHE